MSDILIKALQNPALYPHPVSAFEVIQTHLSWVILTGHYAYKIKKPLNLGFQDFTTLEKRKYYCELEVILNKRLAPQIYVEAVPLFGNANQPQLQGQGDAFEYAVKMNQFPQSALLSNIVKEGKLSQTIVDDLAKETARFHIDAEVCSKEEIYGGPEVVYQPMLDNFSALKTLKASLPYIDDVNQIEAWTQVQYQSLKPLLAKRKANGFIRATHGDLHLGNIILLADKPVIFDCIEFNESFRWTDVMGDVGFFTMDLDHRQLSELSYLFLNKYFEQTNDYEGAVLLRFYQCYRAMVRAKVSALQLDQVSAENPLFNVLQKDLNDFLTLGNGYTQKPIPSLTITYGLSGSGKTLYTDKLMMTEHAIRLRADVIRKQLHGLAPLERPAPSTLSTLYSPEATQTLYQTLQIQARALIQSGQNVIVDATCLKQWQRQLFIDVANELKCPFKILSFEAPIEVLKQRLALRKLKANDASDADAAVLELQLSALQPLTAHEKSMTPVIPLQS